ncbi:MAG: hypothetical protein FJ303_22745 [Planctomycetes bacterium]|nr:hypothetical protein [Planctomycetota bacterium]
MALPSAKTDGDDENPAPGLSIFAPELERQPNTFARPRRRVLMLYNHHWTHVKTIAHSLESFYRFSRYDVYFATSSGACQFDLDYFDAVVIHYSVRTCFSGHLSGAYDAAIQAYRGIKAIFLQDEYDMTDAVRDAIERLGINIVFTCVPESSVARVYSPGRFGNVRFVNVLTGYVPFDIHDVKLSKPMRERPIVIGYRGRRLGWWYGDLGQEKLIIGQRMKEICSERNIPADIAWEEADRIYGDDWFRFLANCKATLGTESGANVFDHDGTLSLEIKQALLANPDLTYREVHDTFLRDREGEVDMNQISPKIFEAIACRTALVLFEGQYSKVLEPDKHFIPLKKDFSNIDDVLARVSDDACLEALTARAYRDIVESEHYTFETYVDVFDRAMEEAWKDRPMRRPGPWLPLPPADAYPPFRSAYEYVHSEHFLRRVWAALPGWLQSLLGPVVNRQTWHDLWLRCPTFVRNLIDPVFSRLRRMIKREQ